MPEEAETEKLMFLIIVTHKAEGEKMPKKSPNPKRGEAIKRSQGEIGIVHMQIYAKG